MLGLQRGLWLARERSKYVRRIYEFHHVIAEMCADITMVKMSWTSCVVFWLSDRMLDLTTCLSHGRPLFGQRSLLT
jgi:hypothetical protein